MDTIYPILYSEFDSHLKSVYIVIYVKLKSNILKILYIVKNASYFSSEIFFYIKCKKKSLEILPEKVIWLLKLWWFDF